MKFKEIPFSECRNLTDDQCVVMLGVLFNYEEDELRQVTDFFHEIQLLPQDKRVTDLRKVSGNVLGDEGRSDVVIMFDSCCPNPMARMRYGQDIKWVSDYVVNYAADYGEE